MTKSDRNIRVLVVDDHPVVRDGVTAQVKTCSGISIIGLACTGLEAVDACTERRPGIVLLDLRLPDLAAHDVVRRISSVSPESKVLIFTAFPEHVGVAAALAAGASGLLVKEISASDLCGAIKEVDSTGSLRTAGRTAMTSAIVTAREYDILRLVAAGNTNNEIGTELNLSINTVKSYLRNVMQKLSARNRTQLIVNARSRGFL